MIIPQKKNLFVKIRDDLWNYPYQVLGKRGIFSGGLNLYKMLRPFSHILIISLVFASIGLSTYLEAFSIVKPQGEVLYEGIITGDTNLSRINPLLPTNKQFEIDLANLIYLPLVRVAPSGDVVGVLASSWEDIEGKGMEYRIQLRNDVFWHDREKFTADDVVATFEVLKSLGGDGNTIVSKNAELASKAEVVREDDYNITIKLEELIPTFYEDLSFGILPKHILEDVSLSTFSWAKFNLSPIGTGPFIFSSFEESTVSLVKNPNFFGEKPRLDELKIHLYKTGDEAVEALKGGLIHILTDPSTAILDDLTGWSTIEVQKSSNLYRRYFGVYFNMKNGGLSVFEDVRVRRAISSGINREEMIKQVATAGAEAKGPIPENSWAYNKDAKRYSYDPVQAKELLEEAEWEQKELEDKFIRMKDEEILRFELAYLDKYDRQIVAESIQSDMEKLGIVVNLNPVDSSDLNEALIATRNFEAVLYGVETPIDPDRIRLWHSEAIDYPGLNIASYESSESRSIVGEDQELEKVSLIDVALENGRSSLDHKKRIGGEGMSIGYARFQELLLEDCPVVFLYHPVFSYAIHSRVKGIDLSQMTTPEDRYLSITDWYIE
jgi:peptide/nickel transport system substrate-binding protein